MSRYHPAASELSAMMRSLVGNQKIDFTQEDRVRFARAVRDLSYRHTQDDREAFALLASYADELADLDPAEALLWKACVLVPNEQLVTMWAGRWCDQGFPRVVMDAKYAALLMATEVPDEELVRPPWRAFLVDVPAGLVTILDPDTDVPVDIRHVYVHVVEIDGRTSWNFVGQTAGSLQVWRHGLDTRGLTQFDGRTPSADPEDDFLLPMEDRDERVLAVLGRLIASICVAMSDPRNFHEQKRTKGRGGPRFSLAKKDSIRTYVLGRPVTIDCRPAIQEYVEHGGRRGGVPKVRFLVRGHWRRVPCGPRGEERRIQHIEPYWKGPREAPVVPRTVILGSGKSSTP